MLIFMCFRNRCKKRETKFFRHFNDIWKVLLLSCVHGHYFFFNAHCLWQLNLICESDTKPSVIKPKVRAKQYDINEWENNPFVPQTTNYERIEYLTNNWTKCSFRWDFVEIFAFFSAAFLLVHRIPAWLLNRTEREHFFMGLR